MKLLVTCKSMPRVLAYAMGVPTVVVEPCEGRRNKVFDPPPGWRQDRFLLDGFDARELVSGLRGALEGL